MITLRVYIAGHCPVSAYSIELAREVAATFPQLAVNVIEVDGPDLDRHHICDEVLFTPGYFLNGRPIAWGNPARDDLFGLLSQIIADDGAGDAL